MSEAHFRPALYSIIQFAFHYSFWFYYIDFIYFGVCFLPLSVQGAYFVLADDMEQPARLRFALIYGLAELFVVVSALGYSFFLFPIYSNLDDTSKICWRLFLHPVWFELTMMLPQRILAKDQVKTNMVHWRFLVVLHSLSHSVTIGRMLIMNVSSTTNATILIFLTNIQEFVMRVTTFKRDYLITWLFCGKEHANDMYKRKDLVIVHTSIVTAEMIFEIVGIMISMPFAIFFAKQKYLLNFNTHMYPNGSIINNTLLQIIFEFVTDVLCILWEIKYEHLPLMDTWRQLREKRILLFCAYAICTMGILGMIYTSLRVPRAAFCSSENLCSCSYDLGDWDCHGNLL